METQTGSQVIDVTESDYKQWLKEQSWNQPGYIAEKMQQHAEAGELMGAAPVGYRNIYEQGRKEVVIEEMSAALINEAFTLAATGKYSLNQIVRVVMDKGLRSRNRKPLQATGLWRILTNPFYCGQIRYKGKLIVGRHRPLVSQEIFEKVQKTLKSHCRNR